MVTREHLYLLMARCHEKRQNLSRLVFGDPEKAQIRDELVRYADSIYTADLIHAKPSSWNIHAKMTLIVTEMMSCLIDNYNNTNNKELQYVVAKLANEWHINPTDNIILFSYGDYAVRHYHVSIFNALNQLYHVSFTRKPRIVYMPKEYDGDVLFSSVVFHEVGHMVENDHSLGGKVYDELIKAIKTSPKSTILKNYFKQDYDKPAVDEDRIRAYIKEYIADLFGCQYLGRHILHFLNCHESVDRKKDTSEHPCYECREKMVDSFINYVSKTPHSTTDKFLQIIIDVFSNETDIPNLECRDVLLSKSAFLKGNKLPLANQQELFSVFSSAWEASLSGLNAVELARGIASGSLSRYEYYNTINTLTKQSINDYMVNNP